MKLKRYATKYPITYKTRNGESLIYPITRINRQKIKLRPEKHGAYDSIPNCIAGRYENVDLDSIVPFGLSQLKQFNFNHMKKIAGLVLSLFLFQYAAHSQQKEDTGIKTALLIVDIQNFYFPGDGPGLVNAEKASLCAKEILEIFRENNNLVVHVRHKSNKGFEIHKNVEPVANEKVITKEEVNSFQGTDLLEYLKSNNISRLVIIGMQTQMCVEAAIRAAHDFGFECVVIQDACATRDVRFMDQTVKAEEVQICILATITDGGYGKVIDLKSFKENTNTYLQQKLD